MTTSFQQYLEDAERAGNIDLSLRIVRNPDGLLDFYIHPTDRNGETGDFTVTGGGWVRVIPDRLAAGSSRPSPEPEEPSRG